MPTQVFAAPAGEIGKELVMAGLLAGLAGLVVGTAINYLANNLIKCSDVPWLCFKSASLLKTAEKFGLQKCD